MDNQENNNKASVWDKIITALIVISLIIILCIGVANKIEPEKLYIDLDLDSKKVEFVGTLNTSDDIIGCKIIHNKKIKSFDDFKEIPRDSLSLLKQYPPSIFKFTHIYEAWSEFLGIRRCYTILQLEPYGTKDTILVTIPLNEKLYDAVENVITVVLIK